MPQDELLKRILHHRPRMFYETRSVSIWISGVKVESLHKLSQRIENGVGVDAEVRVGASVVPSAILDRPRMENDIQWIEAPGSVRPASRTVAEY